MVRRRNANERRSNNVVCGRRRGQRNRDVTCNVISAHDGIPNKYSTGMIVMSPHNRLIRF